MKAITNQQGHLNKLIKSNSKGNSYRLRMAENESLLALECKIYKLLLQIALDLRKSNHQWQTNQK
jgi:hypothetical protein